MDYLGQQGLTENTLLLYVADNGWFQNPNQPGPVRSKTTPYDGGLRTPIMVRCRARYSAHERRVGDVDRPGATILAALGMQATPDMQASTCWTSAP